MDSVVVTETWHWLAERYKLAAKEKDSSLYPYETGDAAKLINVTPTELKESLVKVTPLRGVIPPTAHLVKGKFYFFIADLDDFKSRKTEATNLCF